MKRDLKTSDAFGSEATWYESLDFLKAGSLNLSVAALLSPGTEIDRTKIIILTIAMSLFKE